MKQKKNLLDYNQQYNIAEKFIIHNTNDENIPINYKMTSQTWSDVISKWSGTEISTAAINDVMADLGVKSVQLAKGSEIYVFACAISK